MKDMTYEEALELLGRYPAFTYAAVAALRKAPDAASRNRLRSVISANTGDEGALHEVLGLDSETLGDFYPDSLPPQLDTDNTIDAFLERFGGEMRPETLSPAVAAVAAGPVVPPDPEPEVSAEPESEESAGDDAVGKGDANAGGTALTEGLARILIKNGNYSKALEIITELNLKNSEKSIYFADQIRFLKKLILNEERKRR